MGISQSPHPLPRCGQPAHASMLGRHALSAPHLRTEPQIQHEPLRAPLLSNQTAISLSMYAVHVPDPHPSKKSKAEKEKITEHVKHHPHSASDGKPWHVAIRVSCHVGGMDGTGSRPGVGVRRPFSGAGEVDGMDGWMDRECGDGV